MGYFSNGSEGHDYEEQNCRGCVHHDKWNPTQERPPCPVWMIHQTYNADQWKDDKLANALNMLIPRSEDGLGNEECNMRKLE